MSTLHICSLAKLHETVDKLGARQIVTLLSDRTSITRPETVLQERHLQLITRAITPPMEGDHVAGAQHNDALITQLDRIDEIWLAKHLRAESASTTPNPRLIALADALLNRDSRMIDATESNGRGHEAFESAPFELVYG